MSRTILKSILDPIDMQEISVPVGAEFLCVNTQYEIISLWYRCDPDAAMEMVKVATVRSYGQPAPEDGRYMGTVFLMGGELVLHVFVGVTNVIVPAVGSASGGGS